MKIIVTTSNKYVHLMNEFAQRFNHFWSDREVDVLHYDVVPRELPQNFKCVGLGVQPKDKDWCTGLIPYFDALEDDYFTLMLDDYFICEKVDTHLVRQVEQFCEIYMPDKFDLTRDRMNFPHVYTNWPFLIESKPEARYRSSLQAAIWKKSYFRKFLYPGRTPWQFELVGEKEGFHDGGVIMGTSVGVVKYQNAMLKGGRLPARNTDNIPMPKVDEIMSMGSMANELRMKEAMDAWSKKIKEVGCEFGSTGICYKDCVCSSAPYGI